jgi:hypothetical protein
MRVSIGVLEQFPGSKKVYMIEGELIISGISVVIDEVGRYNRKQMEPHTLVGFWS